MSKLAKNYLPSTDFQKPPPVVPEYSYEPSICQVSPGLKLTLTMGPSGSISLKPIEPIPEPMEIPEEPQPTLEPVLEPPPEEVPEDPLEKWKRWVRKIIKKLEKKGDIQENPEFSHETLDDILINKDQDSIKRYLLPILESLPSPHKVLKRWKKKWDKLQSKINRTISIRFGPQEPVIQEEIPEPLEERMDDISNTKLVINTQEEDFDNKIKISLNKEDLIKFESYESFQEPEVINEPHEDTKVIITNPDVIKTLNEERENKQRQKGPLNVALPSLLIIEKSSEMISEAQQRRSSLKLKDSYSQLSDFPIDDETKKTIDDYITKVLSDLRNEVETKKKEEKVFIGGERHLSELKRVEENTFEEEDRKIHYEGFTIS